MGGSTRLALAALTAVLLAACAGEEGPPADLAAAFAGEQGGMLVEGLGADATAAGPLDPAVTVYGYLIEARAGAVLNASLEVTGPEDATVAATIQAWGPYTSAGEPGALLGEGRGDSGANLAAEVDESGRVLVAFSAGGAAGAPPTGQFRLDVGCEGTDAQCGRAAGPGGCRPATIVVHGGTIDADQTWDACEVLLLESVTIAPGATLSIAPGVAVRAAFVGSPPFGEVRLVAEGTLDAVGSAEAPITFTGFEPSLGWVGLVLDGRDGVLSFVEIDGALTGVDIRAGATATISDAVIRGGSVEGGRGIAGIRAARDVEVHLVRGLVRGFERGLDLENARHLYVEDSVVRENEVGIRIEGTAPISSCEPGLDIPPIDDFVDPVLVHTDVVANEGHGIVVNGSDVLLQVDRCNVAGNETGIEIRGIGLDADSHVRGSNVDSNGGDEWQGHQLVSYHYAGALDATGNFWGDLSEPDLGQAWDIKCAAEGGVLTVDGFVAARIADAGPRAQNVMESVWRESWQQTGAEP